MLFPRHFLRARAFRVLLVAGCLWLLAYAYCRQRFWRDPHSAFFQDRDVYKLKYSLHREREARHFISRYNVPTDPPSGSKGSLDPTICAAVVTVRRETEDYFEPTIGSILAGLDPKERNALQLHVVFSDTDPTRHPSWGQKWVDRVADGAGPYQNVSEDQLNLLKKVEKERNFYVKGVFDYIYALTLCNATNAAYTVVFEDDIILADGWMVKTVKALVDIAHSSLNNVPWIYLRLFYTETPLGWGPSDFVFRNFHAVFGLAMALAFAILMAARFIRPCRSYLDYPTIVAVSLICLPAFMALVYMVGKYSLMPLKGIVDISPHGCCSQGLVFPRNQVDGVVGYLRKRGHGQTDSMIEEYAKDNGLKRYALAPQQLQHVGLKSSRDNTEINTRSTWAFWFEENDPVTLRKEHEQLLNDTVVKMVLDQS